MSQEDIDAKAGVFGAGGLFVVAGSNLQCVSLVKAVHHRAAYSPAIVKNGFGTVLTNRHEGLLVPCGKSNDTRQTTLGPLQYVGFFEML